MEEFLEIANWVREKTVHKIDAVDSLPAPTFKINGEIHVSFSSNNYLGLSNDKRLVEVAKKGLEEFGVGNCESRLLGGNLKIYDDLEEKIAKLKGKEASILFATGYLTNLGVLSTLPKISKYARIYGYRSKKVATYAYFSDEYNHASIKEGIRMSGADCFTFRHFDLSHLDSLLRESKASNKIIVTDGIFSQDGDIVPLPEMLDLATRHNAFIYIDDAHSTGVLGDTGAGTAEYYKISSDRLIQMGTLSKAYGAIGGFVAAKKHIIDLLRLSCSAYGFTSAIPADQILAISKAIDIACGDSLLRKKLWDNQKYFVNRASKLKYKLASNTTPIVPILINSEELSDKFARILKEKKIHVDSVKFPAVPYNKARLRVILNAGHTHKEMDALISVLEENQHLLS